MTTEELRKTLLAAPKNGFTRITAEERTAQAVASRSVFASSMKAI